jgi:hypothetical protein
MAKQGRIEDSDGFLESVRAIVREELERSLEATPKPESESEAQDNNAAMVSGIIAIVAEVFRRELAGALSAERRRFADQIERLVNGLGVGEGESLRVAAAAPAAPPAVPAAPPAAPAAPPAGVTAMGLPVVNLSAR